MWQSRNSLGLTPLWVLLVLGSFSTGCVTPHKDTAPGMEPYLPRALDPRGPVGAGPTPAATDVAPTTRAAAEAPEALTLEACVDIALDRNPVREAARHGVAIAEETVGIARAPYYPELAAAASWSRSQHRPFVSRDFARRIFPDLGKPTDDWLAGFTARYTISDGGLRAAQYRKALALQGAAEEEAEGVRQDLVFEVQDSFYRLAAALQVRRVAEENLSRAQAHRQLAQRLKEAGAVAKADVLRAEVEVADARLALTRAEGLTRNARGQLNVTLGLPAASTVEIAPGEPRISPPAHVNPEKAIEEALLARPEIRAALENVAADEAGVAAARSAYRPRLYAEAGYDHRDNRFPPEDEEWSVGVNLNWTLFSGYARKHELNRAHATLSRRQAEVQQRILRVQQEVWAAHSGVRESREAVETAQQEVASAAESMRAARTRYEVGAATVNDLLDAQTALARAETRHAEAVWDFLIAEAWWGRVRGQSPLPTAPPGRKDRQGETGP